MPLLLTGTWEHALLAATAQAVAESGDRGYLGRAALQRILYFLHIADVPMRYRFDVYYHGPYCDRIAQDVEWLLADDVLTDTSPCPEKYPNYRPGPSAEELIRSHASALEQYTETITRVVRTLVPLEPAHLELLTTLEYLFRYLKAGGGPGPWKERVIALLMKEKKDKFHRDDVSAAYDSMARVNLVEA